MYIIRKLSRISYHIAITILSAVIALSLPYMIKFLAQNFLVYWAHIENEKIFLVSVEISVGIILILFFTYLGKIWRDRRLSAIANLAGFLNVSQNRNSLSQRRMKRLKEQHGFARDVMIIGSTGYRTFVNSEGDLHDVLQNCRQAKIMLLDPTSEGAWERSKSLRKPGITPENFRQQIVMSIAFLKNLKKIHRNIRLKLYRDVPIFKIAIIGDYISIQHYHAGMMVQDMPEYVLKHNQDPGGFYTPFYQYFLLRWDKPEVPEYDLSTSELIYRDTTGNEIRREKHEQLIADESKNNNEMFHENHSLKAVPTIQKNNLKRKLIAILCADVKGYSRMMGEDEVGTFHTLSVYLELMKTTIAAHRGGVFSSPGDAILAQFVSVVNAVECAVEIQEKIGAKNSGLSENRKMQFRIGINLGDVIEKEDQIYGDGINKAARIETLAEPGGISISKTVYNHVHNKLKFDYQYQGEYQVKNITEPVRVYKIFADLNMQDS